MVVAIVLAVRVKNWPPEKKLPPWRTGMDVCVCCGEDVVVTPEYAEMLKTFGFRIRYICNQCALKQRVAA